MRTHPILSAPSCLFAALLAACAPTTTAGAADTPSADGCEACRLPVTRVTPGAARTGSLLVARGGSTFELPLVRTDVEAAISGLVGDVSVRQTFGNPFAEPIEAVYLFPLPDDAAVDDFLLEVGDRRIVGEIHRRDEARALYEDARDRGQTAALLDQERPNLFTQHVANIPPGQTISVQVSFVQVLDYDDGAYAWSFPLVAAPRYVPEGGTGRGDEAAIGVPLADRPTGQQVSIVVDLDAGVPIRDLRSPSHDPVIERFGPASATIQASGLPADQDFVLRYAVAGPLPDAALLTHRGDGDGYALLMIQPPTDGDVDPEGVAARDLIFLIDTSCSQSGQALDSSKDLMHRVIDGMRTTDRFTVVGFADGTSGLSDKPLRNTPENRLRAHAFVDGLQAHGGTEMLRGVEQALAIPQELGRLRTVLLTTDGLIGNDSEILRAVEADLGSARFFTLGTGGAPNRFLIDRLAVVGRGASLYLRPDEDAAPVVEAFEQRFATPLITDLEVSTEGFELLDRMPELLPDLFAGQPLILSARYEKPGRGRLHLTGLVAGKPWRHSVDVDLPEREPEHGALGSVWARAQIEDWQLQQHWDGGSGFEAEITALALRHRLMTEYTSFVAIDERISNEGGAPRTIRVPVEAPAFSEPGVFGDVAASALMASPAAPASRRSAKAGGSRGLLALTGTAGAGASAAAELSGIGSGLGAAGPGYGGLKPAPEKLAEASAAAPPLAVLGSMDGSRISDVMRAQAPRFRAAFDAARAQVPGLRGRIDLRFTIEEDGSVSAAEIRNSTLGSKDLEEAVLRIVRALRFDPMPGGPAVVNFPLVFEPA